MAETYPGTLPTTFEISGFGAEDKDARVVTEMDVGEPQRRRRYSKDLEILNGSYLLTAAQYTTMKTFYRTTLNGGTNTFNWTHPIDSSAIECWMMAAPKYVAEGLYYRCSFAVMVVG